MFVTIFYGKGRHGAGIYGPFQFAICEFAAWVDGYFCSNIEPRLGSQNKQTETGTVRGKCQARMMLSEFANTYNDHYPALSAHNSEVKWWNEKLEMFDDP